MFPFIPTSVIIAKTINVVDFNELSLAGTWIAVILSMPAYYGLYVYLDQIIPDTYGIAQSCCFCLRLKRREKLNQEQLSTQHIIMAASVTDISRAQDEVQHPVFNPNDPIVLQGLTKKFGSFTAVDNLTLSIRENEVFALLGHNGAGKTTLLHMLTGVLTSTSGSASIYGSSL